jgi:hypothetical protein
MDGLDDLLPPDKDELAVLERIGATPDNDDGGALFAIGEGNFVGGKDQFVNLCGAGGVEAGCWFIEEHYDRVYGECAGNRKAFRHAARQADNIGV